MMVAHGLLSLVVTRRHQQVFCYTCNALVPHDVLMGSIETFQTKVLPRVS